MNFCSKLTHTDLIIELKKRSLPSDGSKEELINRLSDAILQEDLVEIFREEENYDSEDETVFEKTKKDYNSQKSSNDLVSNTSINANKEKMKSTLRKDGNRYCKKTDDKTNLNKKHKINDKVIIIEDEDEDSKIKKNLFHAHQDYDSEENQQRSDDNTSEKGRNILWVYKVKRNVKAVDLKDLLSKYGKVLSVKIVMNGKSPSGNCFGCIQLSSGGDVDNCIKHLNKTEFRGNIISVTKNINDITHADLIEGNGSPVSTDYSWHSPRKQKDKSSLKLSTPFSCGSEVKKVHNGLSNSKYSAPDRVVNSNKDYHRDSGQYFRGRGYRRSMNTDRYGPLPFRSSDYRCRDSVSDSRGSYRGRYESQYRDRPEQDNYSRYNRHRPSYDDSERVSTSKYDHSTTTYDRPNYYKRPFTDYKLTRIHTDQLPFKRVRSDYESARVPKQRYQEHHQLSPYHGQLKKESYRPEEYYRQKKEEHNYYERQEYYPDDSGHYKRSSIDVGYPKWKTNNYYNKNNYNNRESYHNKTNYRPRNY